MKILALSNLSPDYQKLAENFLLSLLRAGVEEKSVHIHAIDHPSGDFGTDNFNNICFEKLRIVRDHLLRGETVVWSDIDIFFLRDPREHLVRLLEQHELVAQRGYPACLTLGRPDPCLCAGFFAVRPTEVAISLFDAAEEVSNPYKHSSDQNYLNAKILTHPGYSNLKLHLLPVEEFPCGYYWFRNHADYDPCLVHYNYIVGSKGKIRKMRLFGHWLVD